MQNFIVWDSTASYDLQLGTQVGKPWFGEAEVICNTKFVPLELLNDPRRKIAFVNYFFGPGENTNLFDLSWADLVVCLNFEVINDEFEDHYHIAQRYFNNANIIFIIGGTIELQKEQTHDRFLCPYLSWFNKVVQANDVIEYNYTLPRPYLFDALLGGIKFHRKIVFDKLYTSGLLERSLVGMTPGPGDGHYDSKLEYTFTVKNFTEYYSPNLYKYEDPDILEFKRTAVTPEQKYSVNSLPTRCYKGMKYYHPSMSVIIPNKIYENTWYSIITETNFLPIKFMTEKTAKALFSKRIFVCFGSQGHLKFLQEQGYKTFDNLIDESYDQEPNLIQRYEMAWQQVLHLAAMDPVEAYKLAMPVLEHNFKLINQVDKSHLAIQNFIKRHIDVLPT